MNYRKLWVKHFGVIPIDENGISYEIHHIDGDRSNNDLSNLSCLSIKEHFSIHHSQGDWQAAERILQKIKNIESLAKLGWTPKTYAQWQAKNKLGIWSPEIQAKALNTKEEKSVGFCHDPKWASIGGKIGGKTGAAITNELCKKNETGIYSKEHQSKAGTAGGKVAGKLLKGKLKPVIQCPHCKKSGGGQALMQRWHFDNCKLLKPEILSPRKLTKSESLKEVWRKRKTGELPQRKTGPRGPYKTKIQEENQ